MNVSAATSAPNSWLPAATAAAGSRAAQGSGTQQLSQDDQALVRKLKARDQVVRQHEQAHLSSAGGLATSAASYTYQRGPDGVNYAIGGEVHIDTSPGRTPEDTISRARTIQAAALAPADPSPQDRAVAAQAAQMLLEAQDEQARQQNTDSGQSGVTGESGTGDERKNRLERFYAASDSGQASAIEAYA
jgi:hypothetical protein